MAQGIELVLFDLGGVLMKVRGATDMQSMAGLATLDEVWGKWLSCDWVRSYERGWCSVDEFANGLVADWELTVTAAEFLDSFETWPEGLFVGAADLVAEVQGKVTTGCLSNSNAMHWDMLSARWQVDALFDPVFLSHEIGMLKPDRDVFDHVLSSVGLPAESVFFLDDNAVNVEAARAAGFESAHVQGVTEARDALVEAGVLP